MTIRQIKASDIPSGRPALEGRIFAVRVVSFSAGDRIGFTDTAQDTIAIYAAGATYRSRNGYPKVWLPAGQTTVIEATTSPDEGLDAANAQSGVQTVQNVGSSTAELDSGPIAITAGAVVQLVAANPNRQGGVTVQNVGTQAAYISKNAAPSNAGANASFVAPPGVAANDGKGGGITLANWKGAVYAICPAGLSTNLLVGAY